MRILNLAQLGLEKNLTYLACFGDDFLNISFIRSTLAIITTMWMYLPSLVTLYRAFQNDWDDCSKNTNAIKRGKNKILRGGCLFSLKLQMVVGDMEACDWWKVM